MSNVYICGNPKCCPHIREDTRNGIMYIVEGKLEIPFTKKEVQGLTRYLNSRGM